MTWTVSPHSEVLKWLQSLSEDDGESVLSAIQYLEVNGPSAGRPMVDSILSSSHPNMKELRPPSGGRTELRILFAFDIERAAILLVAGDKSQAWSGWYEANIPIADARFSEHQAALRVKRQLEEPGKKTKRRGKSR
jgi:hypothetical protein